MRVRELPGERLSAVASFVKKGAVLCDVGSDHAKLPIWLFNKEIIERAVITDINEAPLTRARAAIERAGFLSRSLFFCCDGLEKVPPKSFDTAVMAGMGGETIAGIIARSPWLREGCSLILQPNSGQYELRSFLFENGYLIEGGRLAKEAGRFYTILTVRGGKQTEKPHEAALHAGCEYVKAKDPLFCEYADYLIRGFNLAAEGLRASKSGGAPEILRLEEIIRGIEKMKAEVSDGTDSRNI